VVDDFSARYGDLLSGSYDCPDRIVLNAYMSLGSPGGFRTWWRRLHGDSDEELDNTHLMRMAGRFSRRVRGWAKSAGVPVIDCKSGERKHLIAEEYLATHRVGAGVFMVLVARAPAAACEVERTSKGVILVTGLRLGCRGGVHRNRTSGRGPSPRQVRAGWAIIDTLRREVFGSNLTL
jgi:hypothetical protein